MPTVRHCPECSAPLPDDAEGCCPVCAFQGALGLSAGEAEVKAPAQMGAAADADAAARRPYQASEQIGRYKLLEKIGEGGWGVVYMAEQAEPIRRRVALKVVKLGMDTKQVIARFEAERQALALMDHPNIARVLDAGATETGRPFFVMELVRGTRITEYCDHHKLSTRERLDLFVQVCHAVQHAHQKGIIHRDIKPSNILVTMLEGAAVPKVIDFGIAKATQQPLTDKTVFTSFQQFIGTPAYMSPEQIELSSDVDTRSDIYTLGVLLYELLTGQTPFEKQELLKAGFDEMRRLIREKEPQRPSTRLSTLAAADLTTVAKHQRTDPPKLIHLLRGDLDWIVMKCLEKERARRYDTANDLAQDIERHLQNQPVTAAAPSAVYRTRKFIRRHQLGLSMASGLVLLLAAGVAGIAWEAVLATRAQREQSRLREEAVKAEQNVEQEKRRVEEALKEAKEQRNLAESSLTQMRAEKAEKERALQKSQTAETNAVAAADRAQVEKAAADEARKNADKLQKMAGNALVELQKQRDQFERVIDFNLSEKPIGRLELLRKLTEQITAHCQSLPAEEQAGLAAEDSLARRLAAFNRLGYVMALQGDGTNAVTAYRTSLEIAEKLSGVSSKAANWQAEVCVCHQRLGEAYEARGDLTEALVEFQASLTNALRLGAQFPLESKWQTYALASSLKVGDMLRALSQSSKALASYERGLQIAQTLSKMDPENSGLAASYNKLGSLLLQDGPAEKAREACRNGFDIANRFAEKEPGNSQWQIELATAHDNFGDICLMDKEREKALEHYHLALEIRNRLAATDPSNTLWQNELARSYRHVGRVLGLETTRSKAWTMLLEHWKLIEAIPKTQVKLAENLLTPENRGLEAYERSLLVAQELAKKDPGNAQWQEELAESYSRVGDALLEIGDKLQREAALAQYREALNIRKQLAGRDAGATHLQRALALSHADVAVALRRLGKSEEAMAEARSSLRIFDGLVSRWPGNLAFAETARVGKGLSTAQRGEIGGRFREPPLKLRPASDAADIRTREDWASYCSEMAVANLFAGDLGQTVVHAQIALQTWQKLSQAQPANDFYKARLAKSRVALAAFQILNGQSTAAIETVKRGLEADLSHNVEVKGMLSLAYLLEGQNEKARALLLENRLVVCGPMQTFAEAVLDDLRLFREKGLTTIDLAAVEQLLASGK